MTTPALTLYLKELPTFSDKVQIHFCERMFRFSGDTTYLSTIKKLLKQDIDHRITFAQQLNEFDPKIIDLHEQVRLTMRRNPYENKRITRREHFYTTNPKLKFYFEMIASVQLFYDCKLHEGSYAKHVAPLIPLMQQHDFSYFFSQQHLEIHPVTFVNCTYYLRNLQVIDNVDQLLAQVSSTFPPSSLQNEELLYDQIYTYTHIIIGESRFYQQFLNQKQVEKHAWIFEFFERNFHDIYQKVNLDLVMEILLCYDLAKKPRPRAIESLAWQYLENFYDASGTYLVADEQSTIADMEHANVLLIMIQNIPTTFSTIQNALF